MNRLLLRGAFAAIGLWLATFCVEGLSFDSPQTLLIAGLLLGLVNAFLRPLLVILTLPIAILSLGLFLLVINASLVGLVAWLLPGMHVAGFWSALATAVIVSLVSWIGGMYAPRGTPH
jgi:putative membrane protein